MKVVPLDKNNRKEWNAFALQSNDAWFWHTTDWMEYSKEYGKESFSENHSFSILAGSVPIAICPLIVEHSTFAEGGKQFSYAGGPIPFPAMRNDLSEKKRQQVLKFYVQTLTSLAQEQNVGYVWMKVPSVAKYYLEYGMPFANPLLTFGFVDLPYLTQIIDLRKELKVLWADMRKGHKSDIKRARERCEVKIWNRDTITAEKFGEYQLLHQKDAGRVTRSQRSFDLMLSWFRQGHAILVEAKHGGQAVAFSLFILFGTGAFYGSSCKDPDYYDIAASHLIQWATIRWLKEHHFEWYDIGVQQFAPQWFDPASPKEISIAFFKRGFGGMTLPLITAEFFYSKALLEQTFESRWQRYLSAFSGVQAKR